MRRTIRGRGARGFIETRQVALPDFITVLKDGGHVIMGDKRSFDERMQLYEDMRRHGLLDLRVSPQLCMRARA